MDAEAVAAHIDENNRDSAPSRQQKDRVRRIAYPHLLAVAGCLAFTLADRGLLINNSVSQLYNIPGQRAPFHAHLPCHWACYPIKVAATAR